MSVVQTSFGSLRRSAHQLSARQVPGWVFIFSLALELGILVRLMPVAFEPFPVNDGGMFLAMVEDIRRAGFSLPAYISYNTGVDGSQIPFAYPPLAFYIAAFLAELGGWSSIAVLQFLPPVVSIATLPAFFWLALRLSRSHNQAALAALIFALVPRSYNWEIMGGGLTRSFGFCLALLTLASAHRLYSRGGWRQVGITGLLGALTLLSHLEMGLSAATGSVLLFFFYGRTRRMLMLSLGVSGLVGMLSAPWWLTVLLQHGISPFWSALQTGSHSPLSLLTVAFFHFSDEPFAGAVVVLGILGLFLLAADQRYFVPVWFLMLFLLDPRKAPTLAMAPISIAAAALLCDLLRPRLRRAPGGPILERSLIALLVIHLLLSTVTMRVMEWRNPMQVLSADERTAMAWIAENTPETASFLLVTSSPAWPRDPASEWFPLLADRTSVTTVQGSEWLPNRRFEALVEAYEEIQQCATEDGACLAAWATEHEARYTHVYVSKATLRFSKLLQPDCCLLLRERLVQDPAYRVVYDGEGALVVAVNHGAPTADSHLPASGHGIPIMGQ